MAEFPLWGLDWKSQSFLEKSGLIQQFQLSIIPQAQWIGGGGIKGRTPPKIHLPSAKEEASLPFFFCLSDNYII